MKTLHVIVSNKKATFLQRDGGIVCGNSDYQIEFHFDSEWDAYPTKTARFIWKGKPKDVEFPGSICPVPIVANTKELEVGVYVEGLSTTTSAIIPCELSILCKSSKTTDEGTVVIPAYNAPIGEWAPETTAYNPGDIVIYNGACYICTQALSVGSVMNIPGAEDTGWERFNGTAGEWVSGKTYNVGDIVTHEGSVYKCTTSTTYEPSIAGGSVSWERLNTYVYEESYSPIACYRVGTIARYNGSVYLCIQDEPNMGYYPDQNPEYWEKLND